MRALLGALGLAAALCAHAAQPPRRILFSRDASGLVTRSGAAPDPLASGQSSTSSLTVTLVNGNKRTLAHTDALFGIPAYQSGTSGLLYYPLRDLDPVTRRVTGCAPFTDGNLSKRIVLVDRSLPSDPNSCFFAQKVANAQARGAYGVVVADSVGLCGDARDGACYAGPPPAVAPQCQACPYRQTTTCQCALPMMADSGSGSAVSIPSMLVNRGDGADLRAAASNPATMPLVSMRWEIPAADGSVLLVMWQDSIDLAASSFRDTWALYVPYLGTSTRFNPHFYVIDGMMAGCDIHPSVCASQCINGGYYCAVDPDGDPDTGISGGDVVLENLRSQCAWEEANSTFASDFGQRWWRYARLYEAACSSPAAWGAACSAAQMRAAGFDAPSLARITACVAASNATAAATASKPGCASAPFNRDPADCDWTNSKLQLELNLMDEMGIQRLPSMLVEGVVIAGNTASPPNVLGAVCVGFGNGKALPGGAIPAVCACGGAAGQDVKACLASLPAAAAAAGPGSGGGACPAGLWPYSFFPCWQWARRGAPYGTFGARAQRWRTCLQSTIACPLGQEVGRGAGRQGGRGARCSRRQAGALSAPMAEPSARPQSSAAAAVAAAAYLLASQRPTGWRAFCSLLPPMRMSGFPRMQRQAQSSTTRPGPLMFPGKAFSLSS